MLWLLDFSYLKKKCSSTQSGGLYSRIVTSLGWNQNMRKCLARNSLANIPNNPLQAPWGNVKAWPNRVKEEQSHKNHKAMCKYVIQNGTYMNIHFFFRKLWNLVFWTTEDWIKDKQTKTWPHCVKYGCKTEKIQQTHNKICFSQVSVVTWANSYWS